MKDNFSPHAKAYAQFRPSYPPELFQWLSSLAPSKRSAWDCGTGNGQVAAQLSSHFETVYATDISQSQIDNALSRPNIIYSLQPAEHTSLADNSFDLITVAQAIHWFQFNQFYAEVNRTIKANGVLAVIGYGLLEICEDIDAIIRHFYREVIGPYWDAERRYIDEAYQTIPFPFPEIEAPSFSMQYQWTTEQLLGYLNTWSAVQHYIKKHGRNPLDEVESQLLSAWNDHSTKLVRFPLLLRIGRAATI
ncbi:MAG: class I SAM-dependent methyltransferase [Bacteroidota bacterium]